MDFLRKLYPASFKLEKKVVKPFVITLVVYVVIGIIMAVISGVTNALVGGIEVVGPIVGVVLWAITTIVDIYCTGGIVVSILKFVGVIKDAPAEEAKAEENND
ncbi:MAG: hypothetical protein IJ309_03615 [Clostridia bacterium]|nr:hypothetical protein [Clostridia bacterium]